MKMGPGPGRLRGFLESSFAGKRRKRTDAVLLRRGNPGLLGRNAACIEEAGTHSVNEMELLQKLRPGLRDGKVIANRKKVAAKLCADFALMFH